jgi:hypothetical protein
MGLFRALKLASVGATALVLAAACSSSNSTPVTGGSSSGGAASCEGAPALEKADFCKTCTVASNASPATCKAPRVIDACCTFVAAPTQELARTHGLNRYSSDDPTIALGCLDDPGVQGTPQNVTLKGYVRLFSSGGDSAGVKVEVFKEGANGALGELVGTAVETKDTDEILTPKPEWLKKCPDGGCSFRAYTYANVPTETPLIIRTTDATGGQQWAPLYDYNIYFANSAVANGEVHYDASAVAATDLNTVASAAGGFTVSQDKGMLAGEVHDCADVRLSGAIVDTDVAHQGDMFYFGENESDPLPDTTRSSLGTSALGLFGTLNVATGTPIHISAVGKKDGKTILLGTYTVQTYPGAVTALSFRGRRPWQK